MKIHLQFRHAQKIVPDQDQVDFTPGPAEPTVEALIAAHFKELAGSIFTPFSQGMLL